MKKAHRVKILSDVTPDLLEIKVNRFIGELPESAKLRGMQYGAYPGSYSVFIAYDVH
jgi:hypothetical protein